MPEKNKVYFLDISRFPNNATENDYKNEKYIMIENKKEKKENNHL